MLKTLCSQRLLGAITIIFSLVTTGYPAALWAADRVLLQSGQYEVTVQLDLPHLRGQGASSTAQICVAGELSDQAFGLVVLSANNPLRFCPTSNIEMRGDELTFDIRCPGKNMAIAQARYQLFSDRFRGRIAMKMGGKNMTMQEVQIGRRIGECLRQGAPRS